MERHAVSAAYFCGTVQWRISGDKEIARKELTGLALRLLHVARNAKDIGNFVHYDTGWHEYPQGRVRVLSQRGVDTVYMEAVPVSVAEKLPVAYRCLDRKLMLTYRVATPVIPFTIQIVAQYETSVYLPYTISKISGIWHYDYADKSYTVRKDDDIRKICEPIIKRGNEVTVPYTTRWQYIYFSEPLPNRRLWIEGEGSAYGYIEADPSTLEPVGEFILQVSNYYSEMEQKILADSGTYVLPSGGTGIIIDQAADYSEDSIFDESHSEDEPCLCGPEWARQQYGNSGWVPGYEHRLLSEMTWKTGKKFIPSSGDYAGQALYTFDSPSGMSKTTNIERMTQPCVPCEYYCQTLKTTTYDIDETIKNNETNPYSAYIQGVTSIGVPARWVAFYLKRRYQRDYVKDVLEQQDWETGFWISTCISFPLGGCNQFTEVTTELETWENILNISGEENVLVSATSRRVTTKNYKGGTWSGCNQDDYTVQDELQTCSYKLLYLFSQYKEIDFKDDYWKEQRWKYNNYSSIPVVGSGAILGGYWVSPPATSGYNPGPTVFHYDENGWVEKNWGQSYIDVGLSYDMIEPKAKKRKPMTLKTNYQLGYVWTWYPREVQGEK